MFIPWRKLGIFPVCPSRAATETRPRCFSQLSFSEDFPNQLVFERCRGTLSMRRPLTKHETVNGGRLIQAQFLGFTAHIDPWISTSFMGLICVRAQPLSWGSTESQFQFATLLDRCFG